MAGRFWEVFIGKEEIVFILHTIYMFNYEATFIKILDKL